MEISGVSAGVAGRPVRSDRGLEALKSEDFFRILVTELQQQDPFEPADTSDMINQVSEIRSIELSSKLSDTLGKLAGQQQRAGVSELIGKFVTAEVPLGDGGVASVQGVVTGVRFDADGTAMLELDTGEALPADLVTHVTTLTALESGLAPEALDVSEDVTTDQTATPVEDDKQAATQRSRKPPWLQLTSSLRL
ncbi:MAG: hypothetical protein D6744_05210 [Planctomycetota bacterium]|nr:MAG: hypothetical protein D6744_05210 [Planctomycetota bacterium]